MKYFVLAMALIAGAPTAQVTDLVPITVHVRDVAGVVFCHLQDPYGDGQVPAGWAPSNVALVFHGSGDLSVLPLADLAATEDLDGGDWMLHYRRNANTSSWTSSSYLARGGPDGLRVVHLLTMLPPGFEGRQDWERAGALQHRHAWRLFQLQVFLPELAPCGAGDGAPFSVF